jgi:hypothetical protein
MVIPRDEHRLEIQFNEWDTEYNFTLEIHRGPFQCSLPVTGPTMTLSTRGLAYVRRPEPASGLEAPAVGRGGMSLKGAIRAALDWETVTPLDELRGTSLGNRVKRGLRRWQHTRARTSA